MKKTAAIILSIVLVFATSTTSFAKEIIAPKEDIQDKAFSTAIETLSEFIARSDQGTLYIKSGFDTNDIDQAIYLRILNGMEVVNSMIVTGYLVADDKGDVAVTEKYLAQARMNAGYDQKLKADKNGLIIYSIISSGETKIVWRWYGFDLYLDSVLATQVAAGIGITGLLSILIPDPVIVKVLTFVLGVSVTLISYHNAAGSGVIIKCSIMLTLWPPWVNITPFWISSQ